MKIVHFSDPHAGGPAEDWLAYFDKRWVGVFNYRFRRQYRVDLERLRRAVEYILDTKPDVIVCTGDLTSTGQPGEFEKISPYLEPLKKSGIPFLYMPGNHDCYVHRPKCVKAMKEMVQYLSGGLYSFDELPAVRRIAGADFILLNTSRPSNLLCSWGFVNKKDSAFIEEFCNRPQTAPRILLSHYPMIEEHPFLRLRHALIGQKNILKLMREKKIDLSLCGHVHKPSQKVDADGRGEVCAGSVTMFGIMAEIDVDTETRRIQTKVVYLK